MEQKLREEKEFKKFENDLEDDEIKQEEDIIKDDKEEEKEIEIIKNEKKQKIKNEYIMEKDEKKKVFKINNIKEIKEVIIHNTINSPPTRCYLTSEYSPILEKIIILGGSDINSEIKGNF